MSKKKNVPPHHDPTTEPLPPRLLEILRHAADAEQLRLKPLPPHAAAQEEEHLRQHYALLLAALLTAQPQVSEPQSRLLILLLDALQLGDRRAALFEQARELAPETLLEAARLIREHHYAEELLVDALVLLRLDKPLSNETAQLLGELASFLGLDEATVQRRSLYAALILGLGGRSEHLVKIWPDRIHCTPLTNETLKQELHGGVWYWSGRQSGFSSNSIQANNAVLIFEPGASIYFLGRGAHHLKNCYLQDACLMFDGGPVTLDNCDWQGDYATKQSALVCYRSPLTVTRSRFATRNTTAIKCRSSLTVRTSQFTACGGPKSSAGAIVHESTGDQTIVDCRFEECVGSVAGALHVDYLQHVTGCEFIACSSTAFKEVPDLAVATEKQAQGNPAVTASVFRDCSLSIGDASWEHNRKKTLVTASQFHNGNLYYQHERGLNTIHSCCTFTGSQVIEKELREWPR